MAFKEKMKKVGNSIKTFFRENSVVIAAVATGLAVTGVGCYAYYKSEMHFNEEYNKMRLDVAEETERAKIALEQAQSEAEDKTAWNKDWDEFGCALEHLTHQPYGNITADDADYKDPLDGNCFIVAGYNSLFNDSSDQLRFYALDNEGWWHQMPDDVYSA